MNQHMLQEENYQLKNEITDLKNAFDLNRDILKILSNYNHKTDHHYHLLMQIITRLTTVNNQAMLNNIDLIHQKNQLKQKNHKLLMELNQLQMKLQSQIQINKMNNQPNQSKMVMQQQFNSLSKELMAANEERIIKEHQITFWKDKFLDLLKWNQVQDKTQEQTLEQIQQLKQKIKRKYASDQDFRHSLLDKELDKQNRKLKLYIEQLEHRLIVLIKAHQLQQNQVNQPPQRMKGQQKIRWFQEQRQEIRLFKYALNDIQVLQKEGEKDEVLTITQRFRDKETVNSENGREKRSISWPKNNGIAAHNRDQDEDIQMMYNKSRQIQRSRVYE